MSARAVINTPREDREGDVIVPRGVHLDNYRNNPVVLWEHGLGELTRPIAKCQQPDGKLALDVSDHEITATSFFTDKCLESLQIFHLIAEGLVRAASVRALPIKSAIRKTSNAGSGIILKEWELIGGSWGALGVNPGPSSCLLKYILKKETPDDATRRGHPTCPGSVSTI